MIWLFLSGVFPDFCVAIIFFSHDFISKQAKFVATSQQNQGWPKIFSASKKFLKCEYELVISLKISFKIGFELTLLKIILKIFFFNFSKIKNYHIFLKMFQIYFF